LVALFCRRQASMNQLYAWGQGLKDQAFGRSAVLWKPTVLDEFDGDIRGVAVSHNRIVAWDSAGSAYSWYQADGKTGTRAWELEPKLPQGYGVLEASCSDDHIVVLSESGSVYCWGLNAHGQLGTEGPTESRNPVRADTKQTKVVSVCAAVESTVILSNKGEALLWGRDGGFRIMANTGRAARQAKPGSPQQLVQFCKQMLGRHVITKIACGGTHGAAVTDQGMLLSWGHDRFGQLGHGSLPEQAENERRGQGTPVRVVQYFDDIFITEVACGEAHTVALDDQGSMYSWGWNAYGQLGLGNTSNRQIPKLIPTKHRVRSVSTGFAHSLAITETDRILAWGSGQFGQLGTEKAVNAASPKLLDEMPGVSQVLQVGCGKDFSVALVVGNYEDGPSAKEKEPYTDVAGSEITLVRKLEDLKQQLSVTTEYSLGSEAEIENINGEMSLLRSRIQTVEEQCEEIRQEELELAALVPHESWSYERQERELKVVLGQQEEEYLHEKELLEELRVALSLQEGKPEVDSLSDLHADLGNLKRELEWHTNEQLRIFEQLELRKLAAKVDLENQVVLLRQRAEEELNSLKNSTNLGKDLSGLYRKKAELLQAIKVCDKESNQIQQNLASLRDQTKSLGLHEIKQAQHDLEAEWMHELEITHDMKKKAEIAAAEIHVGKTKANADREQLKADAQHVQKKCEELAQELAQQPQMVAQIRLQDLNVEKYEADKDAISQAFKEDIAESLDVDVKDVQILEVKDGSLLIKFSVKGDKETTEAKLKEQHGDNNSMLYEGQVTHSTDSSFLEFYTLTAEDILTRIKKQVRGTEPSDDGNDSDISVDEPIVWPETPPKSERPTEPVQSSSKEVKESSGDADVKVEAKAETTKEPGWFRGGSVDVSTDVGEAEGAEEVKESSAEPGVEEPASEEPASESATEEAAAAEAKVSEPAAPAEPAAEEAAPPTAEAASAKSAAPAELTAEEAAPAEPAAEEAAPPTAEAASAKSTAPAEPTAEEAAPAEPAAAETAIPESTTKAAANEQSSAENKTTPAWFGGSAAKSTSHIEEALQAGLAATSDKIAEVIDVFDELGGGMEKELWLHAWEFLGSNEFGENLEYEFKKAAGDRYSITFAEFFPMFHAKMETYGCDINEEFAGATFKQVDDDGSGEIGVDAFLLCCFLLVSHMKLKAGESRLDNLRQDIKIRAAAANEKLRDASPTRNRWASAKAKSAFGKVRTTFMASQFTSRAHHAAQAKDKFAANVSKRTSPERVRDDSPPK